METAKNSMVDGRQGSMRIASGAVAGLVLAALAALPASAARQSADCLLPVETLNASGSTVTNGSTRMDGGLDLWIGAATNSGVMVKSGFQGQIYALTGLTVRAVPPTVDETATRALSVVGLFDDETQGALEKTPQWQVLAGPILTVDTNGIATADTVYQDTAATVQTSSEGLIATLGLTVLDTLHDNYGLYAGDGVADLWQVNYFGLGNADALADQDSDGDGQDNRYEFLAGTLPTDGHSFLDFRIKKAGSDRLAVSLNPTYADRRYTVYATTRLSPTNWQTLVHTVTNTVGLEQQITDLDSTNKQAYYQVRIGYNWE